MIKKFFIFFELLFVLSFTTYAQSKKIKEKCNENKQFRIEYFKCIDNVDAYAYKRKTNSKGIKVTQDLLIQSLKTIGKFSEVDWSLLGNYSFNYSDISKYLIQKKKWINWYELNKCRNLKWPRIP